MDRIILSDIQATGCHGASEWEKREAQPFRISLTLITDTAPAGKTDDLDLTVDYGDLYIKVKKFVEISSYNLIEALAENIAAMVLADQRVEQVAVEVTKIRARKDGEIFPATVSIERRR